MPALDPLAKAFVDTALQFRERAPWERVPEGALFLIRMPVEGDALVASVMGRADDEAGLAMFVGSGAMQAMAARILEGGLGEIVETADLLTVTFPPLAEVPKLLRGTLQAAGYRGRKVAPLAAVTPPFTSPCPPDADDLQIFVWALRCMLEVDERGWLAEVERFEGDEETVLEFEISGELDAPEVRMQRVPVPVESEASETPLLISLPPDLAKLPRIGEDWMATLVLLGQAIEGEVEPTHVFVVADGQGLLRCGEIAMGEDLRPVGKGLAQALRGGEPRMPPGRPRRIVFREERLHRALSSSLATIDVEALLEVDSPSILALEESFEDGLEEYYEQAPPPESTGGPPTGEPTGGPPTLEAWTTYLDRSTFQLSMDVVEMGLETPHALALYFGSVEDSERILDEFEEFGPERAFHEWLVTDYRPEKDGPSHVDRLLANVGLPSIQRTLLEARRAAEMSIYHIVEVDLGVKFELEDAFTGARRTVYDDILCTNELVGCYVPLRLLLIADWTFASLAGPAMLPAHFADAVPFLESIGVTLTPEGIRSAEHGLGALWSMLAPDAK